MNRALAVSIRRTACVGRWPPVNSLAVAQTALIQGDARKLLDRGSQRARQGHPDRLMANTTAVPGYGFAAHKATDTRSPRGPRPARPCRFTDAASRAEAKATLPVPRWPGGHPLSSTADDAAPEHLRGTTGERRPQAPAHGGLKFLTRTSFARGEIDLVFRDDDCLVFCGGEERARRRVGPTAAAVNAANRRRLSLTALDYLRRSDNLDQVRFDIVEVLLDDGRSGRSPPAEHVALSARSLRLIRSCPNSRKSKCWVRHLGRCFKAR